MFRLWWWRWQRRAGLTYWRGRFDRNVGLRGRRRLDRRRRGRLCRRYAGLDSVICSGHPLSREIVSEVDTCTGWAFRCRRLCTLRGFSCARLLGSERWCGLRPGSGRAWPHRRFGTVSLPHRAPDSRRLRADSQDPPFLVGGHRTYPCAEPGPDLECEAELIVGVDEFDIGIACLVVSQDGDLW